MGQDLRSALARLDAHGQLLRLAAPLSWEFELAAVLWRLQDGPTVLFENVEGYRTKVVGNLLNQRDKLALTLGIEPDDLQERIATAHQNPIPPVVLPEGPCQQVTLPADVDLTDHFPIPILSEHDAGRYISAGVLICRHPESGRLNMAICRMQLRGPGLISVFMAPTHSRAILDLHRTRGTKMQVVVAIGLHPTLLVASQFLTPLDETHVAGGLLGEPMEMVRARTVDLEVPAHAEIVIEGEIDPFEEKVEGPFGEFPGTYAPPRPNPVIRVTGISSREDPIYQMIVAGRHPEHLVTGAIAREAGLYEAIKAVVPGVKGVQLTEGGSARFHAVVSIDKRHSGEPRLAILTAFTKQDLIKHVVVVDDDIDINDPVAVEWAIATRMRAHQDLVVIEGMKSNPVDPMSVDRTVSKLGIDATLEPSVEPEDRQQVGVPARVSTRIDARWSEIMNSRITEVDKP